MSLYFPVCFISSVLDINARLWMWTQQLKFTVSCMK